MTDYIMVPVEPTAEMVDAERGKWHPIDTVPKDGTNVLLWTPDGIIEAHHRKCLHCGDWWHDWQFSVVDAHSEYVSLESQPTHWMPLLDGPSAILAAPAVQGEPVDQHHRDSAELRRLCKARDEQRDGRLEALERAAKAEADVVMLLGLLDGCLNSMRNAYPDYDHYESNAYIAATAVFENRTIGKYPPLYVAPQPTERQPAPDEAGLVEALEEIDAWVSRWCADDHPVAKSARNALAAYRKGGEA